MANAAPEDRAARDHRALTRALAPDRQHAARGWEAPDEGQL